MKYKSFDDLWKEKGIGHANYIKELCLDVWDAAVQGVWEMADQDMAKIKGEKDLLRQTLEAVEWECDPIKGWYCPWCWLNSGYFNCREERKHASDCSRQKALESTK